jgi:hypothetical protein
VTAVGASLRQKLSAYGLAVEQIDDSSFHLLIAPVCVCAEYGGQEDCAHSPAALDLWALFNRIRNMVKAMEESAQFAKAKQGLLIVQGKHAFYDAVMSKEAGLSIWLNQHVERCRVRFLDSHHAWGLPEGADPAAERERLDFRKAEYNSELKVAFAHYEYWNDWQAEQAREAVNVDGRNVEQVSLLCIKALSLQADPAMKFNSAKTAYRALPDANSGSHPKWQELRRRPWPRLS